MNSGEYETMARVEATHWWYRGLRDIVGRTLADPRSGLAPGARILDAGCGTGGNLRLYAELLSPSYLGGFDASEEAIAWSRRKSPEADLYLGDICRPEVHVEILDLVVSLDVVCIPGLERSLDGLRKLVGALRPGGLFVLHLPAFGWLESEHDAAVHTSQRFTAKEVGGLFEALGLRTLRLSYRVFALFPAIVLARLPTIVFSRRGDPGAHSDLDGSPSPRLGNAFLRTLVWENDKILAGRRFPWGSSVFAVGSKS